MKEKSNNMIYRRFGSTELQMPIYTCGGMRYQQSWQDDTFENIEAEKQRNLEACIQRAVECGMNHIETARGYGTSEIQLGRILPSFPREDLIVQTKIPPKESEDEFLKVFDQCLSNLQLDYVDLLGIHGINTDALLEQTLTQGTLSAARKLQDRGLVRHVGFSTHGPLPTILKTIETGEFSYANVHWYYFDQLNRPAIEAATARDMGVFIISPSDKGGKLYEPSDKLIELCTPLTPMAFNDLFCLAGNDVHTISHGIAKPSDFDAHLEALPLMANAHAHIAPIIKRLEAAFEEALGAEWAENWNRNLPECDDTPGTIPVYHILRMYGMAKAFDMHEYGNMRYNLLGNGGHWFPGAKADENTNWKALRQALDHHPLADRMIDAIREAHSLFNAEDKKRLSESE
jgi:predicted aldo/keto reductase-like oxidoreductase